VFWIWERRGLNVEELGMRRIAPVIALLLFASALVAATRPPEEQVKIDWLLAEMRSSGAVFIRNGKEYDGEKAAAHVKSKLWWAGKRVQTVREFIVGVASHSEETGKPYEIRTKSGSQGPLEKWLLERLAVYEKGSKK
jgi:uncharacterized protein DUF5329